MHLEVMVEEPSAEAALENLLPRLLPEGVSYQVHLFPGKPALLSRLPNRLKAYRGVPPRSISIVVLVDEDRQDCRNLKATLETAAAEAGLTTKSAAGPRGCFQVLNRVAVEELEAWFLGDVQAIVAAYPRVAPTLGRRRGYRDPDHVAGGTWEALERVLKRAGYYPGGLPKIEVARRISEHMDPARNLSHSFGVFRSGLVSLAGTSDC
jgi:hypothetical protein